MAVLPGAQIRLSPTIAPNDVKLKLRTAQNFIQKGHRVKLTIQVRLTRCALGSPGCLGADGTALQHEVEKVCMQAAAPQLRERSVSNA